MSWGRRRGEAYAPPIQPHNKGIYERKWKQYLLRKCKPGHAIGSSEGDLHVYIIHFEYEWRNDQTVLLCYGVTEEGFSVCLEANQVFPYFWIRIPPAWTETNTTDFYMRELLRALNDQITERIRTNALKSCWMLKDYTWLFRPNYEIQRHISSYEYHGDEGELYAKVYVLYPQLVSVCRSLLQAPYGNSSEDFHVNPWLDPELWEMRGIFRSAPFEILEGHIPFENRCMVDRDLPCCSWWKIPKGEFVISPKSTQNTLLDYEISAPLPQISRSDKTAVPITLDGFFDIETETSLHFPTPESNRIIQISLHLYLGKTDLVRYPKPKNAPMPDDVYVMPGNYVMLVLTVGDTHPNPRDEFHCIHFKSEYDLLVGFYEIVCTLGPDTIVGHNSNKFDFWFILKRAENIGVKEMQYLGRYPKKRAFWKEDENVKGNSRATTKLGGIVVWDFLHYSLNFLYLQYNSLDFIAKTLLNNIHKKDMDYSEIAEHQKSKDGRTLLADYCNWDTRLVRLFDEKCNALLFLRTLANLCWIDMQNVLDRASEFKIMGLFLWFTRHMRDDEKYFLIPTKNPVTYTFDENEGFSGATVIEPVKGYYKDVPISTLDYTSLYPSIMMRYNLCYSTIIQKEMLRRICQKHNLDAARDVWQAPNYKLKEDRSTTYPVECPDENPSYVLPHVRVGILPKMEIFLFNERNRDKAQMKPYAAVVDRYRIRMRNENLRMEDFTPAERRDFLDAESSLFVWDAAQLGKKIVMNATYGIVAAFTSNMRCLPIAETITREARQFLEFVRYWVETNVKMAMGWDADAQVIYGDTDSAMILLDMPSLHGLDEKEQVKLVWDLMAKIRDTLNDLLPEHLNLTLEKVSMCTIFDKKKKYAMHVYMGPTKAPEILVKGSAKKRRDGCPMKRNLCENLLESLLVKRNVTHAVQTGRAAISKLRKREMPENELLMMKTLRQEVHLYKNQNCEHVVMAKQLKAKGFDVHVGDQMYYMVRAGAKDERVCDRVVHPDDILRSESHYDSAYYEDVVVKEARRLLRHPLDNTPFSARRAWQQKLIMHPEMDRKKIKRKEDKEEGLLNKNVDKILFQHPDLDCVLKSRQMSIQDAMRKQVESRKRLVEAIQDSASTSGPSPAPAAPAVAAPAAKKMRANPLHNIRKSKISSKSTLFSFVTVQDACAICNCTIPLDRRGLCNAHKLMRLVCFLRSVHSLYALLGENLEIWGQCPLCERGSALEETCDRMTCPNWAARRQIRVEYERVMGRIEKLHPSQEEICTILQKRQAQTQTQEQMQSESLEDPDPLPDLADPGEHVSSCEEESVPSGIGGYSGDAIPMDVDTT